MTKHTIRRGAARRGVRRGSRFTLVELLVAMGVFTIILLMVMQFFSGAQRLVSAGNQNNDVYADARVAMDIMSSLIMTSYYSSDSMYVSDGGGVKYNSGGGFLFNIKPVFGSGDSAAGKCLERALYFAVKSETDTDFFNTNVDPVKFLKIYRDGDVLTINIVDSGNAKFNEFFPPYINGAGVDTWTTRKTALQGILDNSSSQQRIIIGRVTGLEFIPMINGSAEDGSMPPELIEIRLSVMDKNNYELYKDMTGDAASEFRKRYERTFSRAVYLGDRIIK